MYTHIHTGMRRWSWKLGAKSFQENAQFAELLLNAATQSNDPLNLIIYSDGISPEDTLNKHDKRKADAVYWSVLEFGPEALSREEVWMEATVARTKVSKKCRGKLMGVMKALLNQIFFNPHGNCFRRKGLSIQGVPIFGEIKVILSDCLAFEEAFLCKGHNGWKLCSICSRVINHTLIDATLVASANGVRSTCTEVDKWGWHDNETIKASLRKLQEAYQEWQRGDMTKAHFEELELVHGWVHTPGMQHMLLDDEIQLQYASSLMYDWMHLYLVNGLLDREFGQLMAHIKADVTYAQLGAYVELWTWPKSVSGSLTHLFDESNARNNVKNHCFASKASELLSLVPVLLRFFCLVVLSMGVWTPQVESFIACLEAVEMIHAVSRGCVTAPVLAQYIFRRCPHTHAR